MTELQQRAVLLLVMMLVTLVLLFGPHGEGDE